MLVLLTLLGGILSVFWYQQIQYLTPTITPINYHPVALETPVALSFLEERTQKRPIFLHFFNPDCPCSRFNQDHFRSLVKKYRDQVDFYTIVQASEEEPLSEELGIPIISDSNGGIADACGVYATPQAVILNANSSLYYRGNYNKARYCTTRSTRFAELALQAAIEQQPLPLAIQLAGMPYGCNLPSDETPDRPGSAVFSQMLNTVF
ncbi:MAG: hypothetical protein RIG62_04420 [Cyclobacteriaceae bacterium]